MVKGAVLKVAWIFLSIYYRVKRCCSASATVKTKPCEIVRAEIGENRVAYEHPRLIGGVLDVDFVYIDYGEDPPRKYRARPRRRGPRRAGGSSSRRSPRR